jgi:hypothetical protein
MERRPPRSSGASEAFMNPFVPEMSRYWLPAEDVGGVAREASAPANVDDDAAGRERDALEALAGRVSAARSVV